MGHLSRFVEPVLLLILKEKGRSHGYDLASEIPRYAFTDAEIERAALYRTLRTLENNGYVISGWEAEESGPARRVYSLTAAGEGHLKQWQQVLTKVASAMSHFIRQVDVVYGTHDEEQKKNKARSEKLPRDSRHKVVTSVTA